MTPLEAKPLRPSRNRGYNRGMCGIAGIIRFDGARIDPGTIDRLTDAIAHRGPDGRGTYLQDNVALGQRRLRILDLSEAAAQPMRNPDDTVVLTFNGEIYNFEELRAGLIQLGYHFTSTGDTEVLLKLYEEYGASCVEKLRGMFAFAVLDRKRGVLFLARDRVGKKPLKYFATPSVFAFASELKALRTLSECPRGMDGESVHHFLTMMYVPSPDTGIPGIRKLPAAHTLTVHLATGKQTLNRYWSLQYQPDTRPTLREWEERVLAVFQESVKLRMRADVPVGAFLSGGVDSAAVVMAMSGMSPRPVETFSIGTKEESHNELPIAGMVAERFGTNHHPIIVEPDIVHLLPELVRIYEEPYADSSSIPTTLIARETKKFVTVALNGDGGDENFAGYVRYPILKFSRLWSMLPLVHGPVRAALKLLKVLKNDTLTYRMLRFEHDIHRPLAERQLNYLSFFTEAEKWALYNDNVSLGLPDTFRTYAAKTKEYRSGMDWISGAVHSDIQTYLADDLLPKVDLGTMASGLEARSPLLDHVLLELTATMPSHFKLHGYSTKWIFKRLLRGRIPDAVLDRRKTGFRLPLNAWFRGPLKSFAVDRLLDPGSPLFQIFDRGLLEAYLAEYVDSNVDLSDHLWTLLVLDEWMRQYT